MWFGTQDGLNQYDGSSFTVYRHNDGDPSSLSGVYITSICEDDWGYIWVGTYTAGLSRYDRASNRFTRYQNDPANSRSLSANRINSICKDSKGNIWVATGNGLCRFDRATESFISYRNEPGNPNSLSNNQVQCVYEDHLGTLWVGTEDGLNRFDRSTGRFTRYNHDPNAQGSLAHHKVNSIYEDHLGVLWIGTEGGLDRFQPATESFIHYRADPDEPASLSHNVVNCVYEDHLGVLWVGTKKGLNRLDRESNQFTHYYYDPNDPEGISDDYVFALYEDRSGVFWIGTYHGGVSRCDRRAKQFAHYRAVPGNPNSLSVSNVWGMCEDSSGMMWIATAGGGLNRFDPQSRQFTWYRPDPNNPKSLTSNFVRVVCEDRLGVLWIGTDGGGLDRFDPKTEQFTHYRNDPNDPTSLSDDMIRAVYEDHLGVLWVGTYSGGLNKLDGAKGQFTRYQNNPDDAASLGSNCVYSIYEDRSGVLWVGTFAGGLNRLDREKGTFTRYQNNPDDAASLSSDNVLTIYEDRAGRLWVGTFEGLNKLDRENAMFVRYYEKEGLPNNVVYGILEDNHRNLWMSTNRGISRFNPDTGTFKNYSISDGLQSDEFNGASYYKSKSGRMYFGGINGFNSFYPDSVTDNPHIPPIVITDLQIFNRPVAIGEGSDGRSILKKSITETDEVALSYKDRVVSFEFAALHYTSPEKNQYAYMMEGFDENWIQAGTRRHVTYTNLPPGQYTFRVKGSNCDGVWNDEGASLKITVTPPYWQTMWFRALSIIGIALCVVAVYKSRTRSIRERGKQLEKRVRERTADLRISNERLQDEIAVRKRAELAAERRASQAALIYAVGQRVSAELKLDVLLSEIVSSVQDAFNYEGVMLLLLDEDGKYLNMQSAAGAYVEVFRSDLHHPLGEGMTGYAALTGKTQISGDVSRDPHYVREADEGTNSELAVPIRSGDKVIGVLDVQSHRLDAFDESDVTAIETLSTQIATAIQNARLFESEQRELAERKRMQKELIRMERLSALGELAAGVSHNLNNILVGVLAHAQLLEMSTDDAEVLQRTKSIMESGRRAEELVRSLNRAVRGEEDRELEAVDVNAVVEETVRQAQPRWKDESEAKGISINVITDLSSVPTIKGTRSGLHSILINLLFNAVDAMPAGGTIRICTRAAGESVELSVSDDGSGMDEETRRRAFEPFFTTKMQVGTGLGLSTVYGTVVRWGGSISVESAPGHGSSFIIRFPPLTVLHSQEDKPRHRRDERKQDVRRAKVLIVEDDEVVRSVLANLLSGKHEVETATSGHEALERFRPGSYDVVVTDLGLPGVRGDHVIKQIGRIDPLVGTVLITGWNLRDNDPTTAVFDFRIQKPFDDLADVQDVVAQAVELHDARAKDKDRAPQSSARS